MAQFSYEAYQKQQATKTSRKGTQAENQTRTKTHFINEWLKKDGDVVVVRFPYHSMEDIKFETTHSVTFPGEKFNKRVRCDGENCPLCKQKVKIDVRFFAKAIVYEADGDGSIKLVPAIWDRPATFADIDIKNLITEYGDLTECLFKIKRNGSGLDTRYSINIITNKVIYNPDVYKADFSVLDTVDPVKVLTKSITQYLDALNPKEDKDTVEKTSETTEKETDLGTEVTHAPAETETQAESTIEEVVSESTVTTDASGKKKYTF